MQIQDITIRNFRGIKLLENLPCGNLNTIVGKNDSGKSCIIKALDTFFNKNFTKHDIFFGKGEDEFTEINIRFRPDFEIHPLALDKDGLINITRRFFFSNTARLQVEEYYTCEDVNHDSISNCFGVKEGVLNDYIGKELELEYKKSGRTITNFSKVEQIHAATEQLGRIEKTHRAEDFIKNLEKQYEAFELPNFSIFDAEYNLDVGSSDFQKQFKYLITQSLEKNKELTDNIENEVTTDLTSEFNVITSFMQKNVPDIEKIQPRVNCNWNNLVKFDLDLKFKDEEFNIPITNKGTGFKRLLMVAYFEYLSSKTTSKNQIFALEEPETYLHPSLQNDLLSSVLTISATSQFFLTTHSPIFAGATKDSNILIVRKENSISKYFNYQNEDDIIKSVIEELGVQPDFNLLKSARFIIFVEGKGDVHFITNFANTVLNKQLEEDGIIVTIGGGSSLKNYADLDLFKKLSNGQSDKYSVLLDGDNGDEAKEKEKEKIREHCRNDGAIYLRLAKRDIENYCHIERIRQCYIDKVYEREGALSRNPSIQKYRDEEIVFDSVDLDVGQYLHDKGFLKFKDEMNIAVFENMTKEEWEEMDNQNELVNFITEIYQRIEN
jgi:putative ATP-dependent endonuclease of the OLD family